MKLLMVQWMILMFCLGIALSAMLMLLWAHLNGQLDDVEEAKYKMMEEEDDPH